MPISREVLARCERLHKRGLLTPAFVEGEQIARGFADIGCEEFLLLPERRLLSLANGKMSVLDRDHERFFFLVPSVDELIDLIERGGSDVEEIGIRGRVVTVQSRTEKGVVRESCGGSVLEALLALYEEQVS